MLLCRGASTIGSVDTAPLLSAEPREPIERLFRDLRSRPEGLADREAARRLVAYGGNELTRRGGRRWLRELVKQFVHPLALLLWAASILAVIGVSWVLGAAIALVVVLNAIFAFWQERQAERATEALREYLPVQAAVLRDGHRQLIDARALVPGDVRLIAEGDTQTRRQEDREQQNPEHAFGFADELAHTHQRELDQRVAAIRHASASR